MKKILFLSAATLICALAGQNGGCEKRAQGDLIISDGKQNGKMGLADEQCNIILPIKYDYISRFNKLLYIVCNGELYPDGDFISHDECGIVDANTGKWVLEQKYSYIEYRDNDLGELCTSNAGGGKIDGNGKVVKAPIDGKECKFGIPM